MTHVNPAKLVVNHATVIVNRVNRVNLANHAVSAVHAEWKGMKKVPQLIANKMGHPTVSPLPWMQIGRTRRQRLKMPAPTTDSHAKSDHVTAMVVTAASVRRAVNGLTRLPAKTQRQMKHSNRWMGLPPLRQRLEQARNLIPARAPLKGLRPLAMKSVQRCALIFRTPQ